MNNNIPIEIYHDQDSRFGFDERERVFPDDFIKVAVVQAVDLEEAFEKTNHIHHSWTDNENVQALVETPRSTSVGDVAVMDGKVYLCLIAGWRYIGPIGKSTTYGTIIPKLTGISKK